jgi:aryl-alcohol dehydrogenase-like predicted oxidoreductase
MKMNRLGKSGLKVSELCLGCMSFGEPLRGGHPWTLPKEDSKDLLRQAIEVGINFVDTANVYSDGSSEEILGEVLWHMVRRDEIVLATKVHGVMLNEPQMRGLSRRSIMHNIDASLKRLRTDHVDLYQTHRWDNDTPIEETMEALHDVVKAGKARYIGASTMWAWQFAKAQEVARANCWTPFASMQNQISLLYREEEREMIPLCFDQGVGLIPWSPIARGKLARPAGKETGRSERDQYMKVIFAKTEKADALVIGAVQALAAELGRPMAQVALAWVRQKTGVTAPIIGVTKPEHLAEALDGLTLTLTPGQMAELEAPYLPRMPVGQE